MLELCFPVANQGKWLWKRSIVDVDDDVLWRSGLSSEELRRNNA